MNSKQSPSTGSSNDLVTLGWREWCSLPDLNIGKLKIKVDTGARTSALHAYFVEPFNRGEERWVKFGVHPHQDDLDTVIECSAPILDERYVSDSGGHKELRYTVVSTIKIGVHERKIEITLTNRDNMKFRMLLGRTAMNGFFMVDPEKSYLLGIPSNNQS